MGNRTMKKRSMPLGAARRLGTLVLFAAALCALESCKTAPYRPSEQKVQKLVALIDKGGVGAVKGLAAAPFLLDGEILLRQADVDSAWANLKAARFGLGSPKLVSVSRPGADSYKLFADRMEVRAFFKNHLDENSSIVALDASGGRYYLLLNREVQGYPRVQGMRGPVK
jgi:hypothetical protein